MAMESNTLVKRTGARGNGAAGSIGGSSCWVEEVEEERDGDREGDGVLS